MQKFSEEVFATQERNVRLRRKGADLWRQFGKPPGKSGELPGKSGKLPGNPWIAVKFHSESPKNFRGSWGNFRGSLGTVPEARGSLTHSQRLAKFVSKEWLCLHDFQRVPRVFRQAKFDLSKNHEACCFGR